MDLVRVSKLLAFVLRHRPDAIGIELDRDGWTDLKVLVERVNTSGRLGAAIDEAMLARVLEEDGGARFSREGERVRARAGHTALEVVKAQPDPVEAPDFLFFGVLKERASRYLSPRGLEAERGRLLHLHDTERAARRSALGGQRGRGRARIIVVEGLRSQRSGGVAYLRGEGGALLASAIPRRFLLSERPGFERQLSAGVVLGRATGGADEAPTAETFEIALIRTKPRAESDEAGALPVSDSGPLPVMREELAKQAEIPPEEEPREEDDRRVGDRRVNELGPPDGVERRSAPRRRKRRRGWGAAGRVELPKGKLEEGERPLDAAIRELREETGLATEIDLVRELPRVRYAFRTPEGKSVYKVVHYFLLRSRDANPVFVPQGKEGIVGVEWTPLRHALDTIAFGNLRPILEAARDALLGRAGTPEPEAESDPDEE